MAMEKRLRFGVLGTGFIADKFAKTFAALGEKAELRAVASRDLEKARTFAKTHGIGAAFGSYRELVESDEVDAVYIATPHNFHLEGIALCAENGKHVLCEKPITVNAAEMERVIEFNEKYGVFIMEAYWTRFLPAYDKFMELLEAGTIGRCRFLRAELGFSHPGARRLRKVDPNLAGGALLDVGVYNVMIAGSVFGYDNPEIQATAEIDEHGVDLYDAFSFRYPNGSTAYLMDSVRGRSDNKLIAYGERGSMTMHNYLGCEKITVDVDGEPARDLDFPFALNGFEYEIAHVCDCVRAGKTQSDRLPLRESLEIMRLTDRVAREIGLKVIPR